MVVALVCWKKFSHLGGEKMSDQINVYLNEWNKNAAILGFINIVGDKNVKQNKDGIIFSESMLDNFSTKYFDYFINIYEKSLSYYKIVSYRKQIEYFEQTNFENFTEDSLNHLNSYIRDTVKYYLKSSSYKAAYPFIKLNYDIERAGKELTVVSILKTKDKFADKKNEVITEVKDRFQKLKKIIDYITSDDGRKYLAAKNVIYTVINKGWDGVAFLNTGNSKKDSYIEFEKYFVQPLKEYLGVDKSKYKFSCCSCQQPIKSLKNDTLSFLQKTGYDVARKNAHAWEFQNDLAICPLCKLLYACLPAGMTYVGNQGIFVNANSSLDVLKRTNNLIKQEVHVLNKETTLNLNTYGALIRSLNEKEERGYEYELEDVQVIRYQNETYRFNILSKNIISVIVNSKRELELLRRATFSSNKERFYIYQLVLERLFNSQNLFSLIHQLIVLKVTNRSDLYYQSIHIRNLIKINQNFLEGGINVMAELDENIVNRVWYVSQLFKKGYNNPSKVAGISHKLLNALRANDRDTFMDIILNCYAYMNQTVPIEFKYIFRDREAFKTIGYSFVSGIIGPVETKNSGVENDGE